MLNYSIAMYQFLSFLLISWFLSWPQPQMGHYFDASQQITPPTAETTPLMPTIAASSTPLLPTPLATQTPVAPNATATQSAVIEISSPLPGQALQGVVSIVGSNVLDHFKSAELAFGYSSHQDTWFLIQTIDKPVFNNILAQWDTTTISDGSYRLRLLVTRSDDSQITTIIEGLRLRNYSTIETETPTPVTTGAATLMPKPALNAATVTPPLAYTLVPATPLPTNPSQLTFVDVKNNLGKSAVAILGLFALIAIVQLIKGIFWRG
jgi:hypothetical protein